MNLILRLVLVCVLFLHCRASAQDLQIGKGLVCDEQGQAETFVRSVNSHESFDISGCAILQVAFITVGKVSEVRNIQHLYAVTEILVIGVVTPAGVRQVQPTKQYTLFQIKEENA